jgi:hypothetical protein
MQTVPAPAGEAVGSEGDRNVMAWRLAQCPWHKREQLDALLREGGEPFAVTDAENSSTTIWLRRSSEPSSAGVVELPRRPQLEREVPR